MRFVPPFVLFAVLSACSGDEPEDTSSSADDTAPPASDDTGEATGETGEATDDTDDDTGDATDDTAPSDDTGETADTGPEPVEPGEAWTIDRDYAYLYWPDNFLPWSTWTYATVRHAQTGYYGLSFDVSDGSLDTLGMLDAPASAEEARLLSADEVSGLGAIAVRYSADYDGQTRAASGFAAEGGDTSNPSRLIDMGRYMQQVEIPEVTYDGEDALAGSVLLAAMPRHFVLTHRASHSGSAAAALTVTAQIEGDALSAYTETEWLDGDRAVFIHDGGGEGWSFILPELDGATPAISRSDSGELTFSLTSGSIEPDTPLALSILALPSNAADTDQREIWLNPEDALSVEYVQLQRDGSGGEKTQPAEWDPERGVWVVTLGDMTDVGGATWPDWNDASVHNWYNRHRIVVRNDASTAMPVPLAFDGGGNAAFYITGGSPLLRDTNGEPLGAPVQISKNWHETPYWYHLYSALELSPGEHEAELTFAHSKWGETYAVSHAQLSLIGWGTNQQWDESALGAWGETITYDPDRTLNRSMVDDVRPFLVDSAGEWGWTGNVGGADFLVYKNESGTAHRLGQMRSDYAYTGPNLTKVVYAGVSTDGTIEAELTTQLGRTDDLARAWYHMEYTFLEDVEYTRIALFQAAADGYSDNGFTRYAYGNADGVTFDEEVPDHGTTGYASESDRGIALEGDAPWVMLYANDRTDGSLPEHLANVGFVIREYEAVIGGETIETPHINIVQTYNGGYSQMGFELGVPYDAADPVIPAGSTFRATVEYLVPPSDQDAYYGESDYLTAMASEDFQSTAMMLALAQGNQLTAAASTGELSRTHPVEIESAVGELAAEFSLSGGLGYTPITIHGLARHDGWRLERMDEGEWQPIDQSVEGNDYWQAFHDAGSGTWDLIFNVANPSDGADYRLTRAED